MFWDSISYSIHKVMVTEDCKECIHGSFNDFVKLFNQYSWEHSEFFKYSLFNYKYNCKIHANIFKFNGIGFICRKGSDYKKITKYIRNAIDYKINIVPIEEAVESRLNKALKSLCSQLNIPLEYKDDLGIAAGHILYHSQKGRLLLDNAKIEILNTCIDKPYVLAHELGHYMAIKQREDRTESGADNEAYKLCCNILSDDEQVALDRKMKIYFQQK